MALTDAEVAFYQKVLNDPTKSNYSLSDLRYAYFLAGLDGSLPGGGGSVSDATTTAKGVVQLAGDLGGTAAAPTVPGLAGKAPLASPAFTGTPTGISKAHVGLGNVDNTSDANKPVSTAQAAADALAVPKSLVTAKGDVVAASGSGVPVRVPVGSNGQVLTADSSAAAGVKWATAAAGGGLPALANALPDKLYSGGVSPNGTTPIADIVALTPVFFPAGMTMTHLIVGVHTVATVSQSFDVGVYDMSGTLLTSATGSTGTTTGNKEIILTSLITLPPAMYWFACKMRTSPVDTSLKLNAALPGVEAAYIPRGNPWDPISGDIRQMSVPHVGVGALPASISGLTIAETGYIPGFAWRAV